MTDLSSPARPTAAPRYAKQPEGGARPRRTMRVVAAGLVFGLTAVGVAVGLRMQDSSPSGAARAALTDDFERPSATGLGDAGGHAWEAVSGRFTIDDGAAVLRDRNEDGPRSITVTEVSATNGTVESVVGHMAEGWGLVFRYVGPFNYWYVQAVPKYAVCNLVRVSDGKATVVATTPMVGLDDGTVIGVVLRGPVIELRVDDRPVLTANSSHALGARKAGLVNIGPDSGASWESFAFSPDRTNPGPNKVTIVGDSGGGTPPGAKVDDE